MFKSLPGNNEPENIENLGTLCDQARNSDHIRSLTTTITKQTKVFIFVHTMDNFQLFVKPVGANCNLRCNYCYYTPSIEGYPNSQQHLMSDELLEKYIIQHIAMSQGPEIFFTWHGGEPLLAGQGFYERAVALQKRYLPHGFTALNGIQTNGTLLTKAWCNFFKANNFCIGISLDGPEKFQSENRKSANGTSSYDAVIKGYRLLQEYGIPNEILCVVNSSNVEYPAEVYNFFVSLGAKNITFIPLVEKSAETDRWVTSRSVSSQQYGVFLCTVFDLWKVSGIGKVKIQMIEEALQVAFGRQHTLCIFKEQCGRLPVIEANGDFFACDHFVRPEYLRGNVEADSLADLLESPQQKTFGEAKLSSLPECCLECNVREYCNGGCPKDRLPLSANDSRPLNHLCEGYKMFFTHCQPFVEQVKKIWRHNQA